jgi:hypothetical protein
MRKKIKTLFYLFTITLFMTFTTTFYFSENNKNNTIKTRTLYMVNINNDFYKLPLLHNDTNNIIIHKTSLEKSKKDQKKRKFWELIND